MEDIVAIACAKATSLADAGAPRHEILTCLVTAAERVAPPGAVASILVIDEHGLLRNGASPNLPRDYLQAIDRLKPDAGVGTCAAAAATGTYFREVRTPTEGEIAAVRRLAGCAAQALRSQLN